MTAPKSAGGGVSEAPLYFRLSASFTIPSSNSSTALSEAFDAWEPTAMAWGAATWTKELPWANSAQSFNFKHGESGKYTLEFWITPFDYAGPEGPQRAVESILTENKIIGLSWIVLDYDGPTPRGFWMLSPKRPAFGHASEMCAFRLMPLEPSLQPKLLPSGAGRSSIHCRLVAFKDLSVGQVTAWK